MVVVVVVGTDEGRRVDVLLVERVSVTTRVV